MATYIAHYHSPNAAQNRAVGTFEYESRSNLNSKANNRDARVAMLERFGNDAISWVIDKTERKVRVVAQTDGQLELDFREPPAQHRPVKTVQRGRV